MKMRNIIPLVTGGTLLATLFGGSTLHAATKSKPNLVLVLVDDMGWGAFAPNHVDFTEKELNQEFCRIHVKDYTAEEAFEAAQKATPYLNRYCQEGVRFTNAYVTANVSAPSRAGLLTAAIWIIYYKRSRNRNSNNGTYYASGYERLWLCERGFWKVS